MDQFTDWATEFGRLNALWIHSGNMAHPHAILTSGKHSSGYFNATKVVEQTGVLQSVCEALADKVSAVLSKESGHQYPRVVVGSAYGAITIAHECAKRLGARMAFTEKENGAMLLTRFSVSKDERALVVEDVLSTGETTMKTIAELSRHGAYVEPVIGVLVNRYGKDTLNGRKIVSLIENPMPMWEPEDCPMCKEGSSALKPKDHWIELTQHV